MAGPRNGKIVYRLVKINHQIGIYQMWIPDDGGKPHLISPHPTVSPRPTVEQLKRYTELITEAFDNTLYDYEATDRDDTDPS
jgi:hypothetical protein